MTLTSATKPNRWTRDEEDRVRLSRVARGDDDAFKAVYVEYHRRLSKFLLRFCDHYPVVEEIINDTMFVVWKQADRYRGKSKVSTWIMGIAFRQATNMLRGIERARIRDQRAAQELQTNQDTNPLEQQTHRDWISAAMLELPVDQRVAVELGYYLGYSCAEIAEICDCPVNTVKSRMFAARKTLQTTLQELSGEESVANT